MQVEREARVAAADAAAAAVDAAASRTAAASSARLAAVQRAPARGEERAGLPATDERDARGPSCKACALANTGMQACYSARRRKRKRLFGKSGGALPRAQLTPSGSRRGRCSCRQGLIPHATEQTRASTGASQGEGDAWRRGALQDERWQHSRRAT
eukprot:5629096-Pleurochrysis_carterae.AAC.1